MTLTKHWPSNSTSRSRQRSIFSSTRRSSVASTHLPGALVRRGPDASVYYCCAACVSARKQDVPSIDNAAQAFWLGEKADSSEFRLYFPTSFWQLKMLLAKLVEPARLCGRKAHSIGHITETYRFFQTIKSTLVHEHAAANIHHGGHYTATVQYCCSATEAAGEPAVLALLHHPCFGAIKQLKLHAPPEPESRCRRTTHRTFPQSLNSTAIVGLCHG